MSELILNGYLISGIAIFEQGNLSRASIQATIDLPHDNPAYRDAEASAFSQDLLVTLEGQVSVRGARYNFKIKGHVLDAQISSSIRGVFKSAGEPEYFEEVK